MAVGHEAWLLARSSTRTFFGSIDSVPLSQINEKLPRTHTSHAHDCQNFLTTRQAPPQGGKELGMGFGAHMPTAASKIDASRSKAVNIINTTCCLITKSINAVASARNGAHAH